MCHFIRELITNIKGKITYLYSLLTDLGWWSISSIPNKGHPLTFSNFTNMKYLDKEKQWNWKQTILWISYIEISVSLAWKVICFSLKCILTWHRNFPIKTISLLTATQMYKRIQKCDWITLQAILMRCPSLISLNNRNFFESIKHKVQSILCRLEAQSEIWHRNTLQ